MDRSQKSARFYNGVFQFSLVTLPYLYYASLCGLFTVLIFLLRRFKRTALDPLTQNSLLVISGWMILSSILAFRPGESFLQLTNFLPFFLFFATLPFLLKKTAIVERAALGMVMAALPINIISLFEYSLKSSFLPQALQAIPWVDQIRSGPHVGRAMVMFEHPNAFASYLVLMLGLGLGLILKKTTAEGQSNLSDGTVAQPSRLKVKPIWLYAATYSNLLGIFCSGSRNGVIVAVLQIVLFSLFIKSRRAVLMTGILGLLAIASGTVFLGIGGRTVSVSSLAEDPRVGVWKIALELIRERPLFGWGLGNYKFLYQERLINPEFPYIAHPHNFWLLLGSEGGIPLMILMTLFVGFICYQAVKQLMLRKFDPSDSAILLGYLFAFLGCISFALFDVTLYDARINVINWVILSAIYSFAHRTPWDDKHLDEPMAED
ncbi:MAG TPA: O-antigen ligase family protein [Crinalium sp.]|jgi:O-antigen ligase